MEKESNEQQRNCLILRMALITISIEAEVSWGKSGRSCADDGSTSRMILLFWKEPKRPETDAERKSSHYSHRKIKSTKGISVLNIINFLIDVVMRVKSGATKFEDGEKIYSNISYIITFILHFM